MQFQMLLIFIMLFVSINEVDGNLAYATCQGACYAAILGSGAVPAACGSYAYCQSVCSYLLWIPFF